MLHHWKIRDLETRKAYFVTIRRLPGITALDQVAGFIRDHGIQPSMCRIIETSTQFVNMPYREYVLKQF